MSSDPIFNTIVAALSAGAAKGITDAAKKGIVDAYEGVKSLIKSRFGNDSEAAKAIDKLEAKPESEGRRQTLGEELQSVSAYAEPELASAAQALLALVRDLPQGEKHSQFAQGQAIAQADSGSTATVNFFTKPGRDD